MITKSCECEHSSHFYRTGGERTLSPYGNPTHKYGVKFNSTILRGVKTPFGTFNVCKDCATDCLDAYTPEKGE